MKIKVLGWVKQPKPMVTVVMDREVAWFMINELWNVEGKECATKGLQAFETAVRDMDS